MGIVEPSPLLILTLLVVIVDGGAGDFGVLMLVLLVMTMVHGGAGEPPSFSLMPLKQRPHGNTE